MINWELATREPTHRRRLTRAATESTPFVPNGRSRWGRSVRGGSFDAWCRVQDRSDATLPVASVRPWPRRREGGAFQLRSARERNRADTDGHLLWWRMCVSRIRGVRLVTVTFAGRLPSPWSRRSLA